MGRFELGVLLFAAVVALEGGATTVAYSTKKTGRDYCTGTFIKERVMATAGHCLDDLVTGGARLTDGTRSIGVVAPEDAVKAGRVDNDADLALVIFPATVKEIPAKIFDGVTKNFAANEAISVESRNDNRARTFGEKYVGVGGHSVTSKAIYVRVTDNAGLKPGDSGAGGFAKDGTYIGPLRGCNGTECGLFLLTSFTGLAVLEKAKNDYPVQMASADEKVTPGRPGVPAAPPAKIAKYSCEASCTITYPRGKPAVETVRWTAYDKLKADAETEVDKELKSNCDEYCLRSRDAKTCTLGAKSCG